MTNNEMTNSKKQGMGCLKVFGLMLLTIIISVGLTVWLVSAYLFPKKFDPVTLNDREETVLTQKLKHFGLFGGEAAQDQNQSGQESEKVLEPQVYSEAGAKREVTFSEKELNAMLAKNTDLADKVAIDLSDNLASARVLIPMDPDFPILGGKTVKASAGMELAYSDGRPIVVLKGVSVWGVPIPNAWLGGLKNVDLVNEFGGQEGFWKSFADGIDNIQVREGGLVIKLKE